MLVNYKLILVQIFFACQLLAVQAEKMMRPKFKDIKLWSDEKYCTHKITYEASDPHLNFTLDVLQEAHDIDLRVEARIVNKLDSFYSLSLNTTVNMCRILAWTAKSPVGGLMYGFLKDHGHIIESCPVAKGQYTIHKFWWPEDSTVSMLPEVDFEVNFYAFHLNANKERKMIINDHITGEFVVENVNNVKPGIFSILPKRA